MPALFQSGFECGARRWPAIRLSVEDSCRHLAELGWSDAPPQHAEAAFLCAACALRDDAACRALESNYFSELRVILARIDARSDFIDEVLQRLRVQLFAGEAPKIASYAARGPLEGWLRMVATRIALRLRKQQQQQQPTEALEVLDRPEPAIHRQDQSQPFRARYARAVERALQRAFVSLPARERAVLRMYFAESLNIDQIGRVYGVNRSTISRWITSQREALGREVRKQLEQEIGGQLPHAEFDSLIALVYDDLDVSVTALLRSHSFEELP